MSSNINLSTSCTTGLELTATMTGSYTLIGTLLHQPIIIIFDNQGLVPVSIGIDGVTTWRTFPAGEALVLDLRAQQGKAPNFTIDKGTTFYATAGSAAGNFSISYIYAQELVT